MQRSDLNEISLADLREMPGEDLLKLKRKVDKQVARNMTYSEQYDWIEFKQLLRMMCIAIVFFGLAGWNWYSERQGGFDLFSETKWYSVVAFVAMMHATFRLEKLEKKHQAERAEIWKND